MKENNIEKLVGENLNFVKSVANKYVGKGVEFDDLVSEGYIAMLQAAQKFEADRGTNFVGYAAPFIRKAMEQAITQQSGVCRVPKSDRKLMTRSANIAVSIDAPLSEGTHYTLLDIQIHIFCDFSQSDMGDAYSIEFSDDFLFSFIQCGDAVLQVVHHLLEYGALVCYQGIFVDQNVE